MATFLAFDGGEVCKDLAGSDLRVAEGARSRVDNAGASRTRKSQP